MLENIWSKFIINRIIDGKSRKVIVDTNGNIINRDPTDEDLKELHRYLTATKDILKLPEKEKREYLLEFLRYFYEKERRPPTARDFENNSRYPSRITYQRVFRSWNNALIGAGLQINKFTNCTNEELLEYLVQFHEENGRPPTCEDFTNNSIYPSFMTYHLRFGSWQKALKLVGLDADSMVVKGIVVTSKQKARLGEIFVKKHFKEIGTIDLSGENCKSPYDGICPKGYTYDVKTSGAIDNYHFYLDNVNKDEIEWYYLLAFNEDFTELLYTWRIPAWDFMEDIEKGYICIGLNINYEYNIENMREYLITDRLIPIFKNWLYDQKKG